MSKNSTMYFLYYNQKVTKAFAFKKNNESINPINRFSAKILKKRPFKTKDKPKTNHEWWEFHSFNIVLLYFQDFANFIKLSTLYLLYSFNLFLDWKGIKECIQSFMHLSKRVHVLIQSSALTICLSAIFITINT